MSSRFEILACPVCGQSLAADGSTLKCPDRHSFDVAAEGYVNLLRSGRTGAGDSAAMIAARRGFLNKGYYGCLREALAFCCARLLAKPGAVPPLLVDAGCGEGYYTSGIFDALQAGGCPVRAAGFDISKPAVRSAAKRAKEIAFAVASLFELPLADDCADVVLNVFAPLCGAEFRRVLRPGGSLIIAAPGRRHLFGLKEVLYDRPYENDENRFSLDGFENAEMLPVNAVITLTSREDIENLFAMTPYYWKTPAEGAKRLETLETLTTEISFELHVLRKTDASCHDEQENVTNL